MVLSLQTCLQCLATSPFFQKIFGCQYLAMRFRLMPNVFNEAITSHRCLSRFSRFRKHPRVVDLPRFDEMYLKEKKESKPNRKYQQTWTEVPLKQLTQKPAYTHNDDELALPKRDNSTRPKTACSLFDDAKMLLPLLHGGPTNRLKLVLAKRRAAVLSAKRKTFKKPLSDGNFTKVTAPFPSYSETVATKDHHVMISESRNAELRPVCSAWADFRENYLN